MNKARVVIEVTPAIELGKPPQITFQTEGVTDLFLFLGILHDVQSEIFRQIHSQRAQQELMKLSDEAEAGGRLIRV